MLGAVPTRPDEPDDVDFTEERWHDFEDAQDEDVDVSDDEGASKR